MISFAGFRPMRQTNGEYDDEQVQAAEGERGVHGAHLRSAISRRQERLLG
jgi:hypothetical protein